MLDSREQSESTVSGYHHVDLKIWKPMNTPPVT